MTTSRHDTQRAHETPFLIQFSIFLPNRVGQLNELLVAMKEAQVEAAGISVVDSTDWGVVRMVFTDPERGRAMLSHRGLSFTECEVLAVVLEAPDTLQFVCKELLAAELNIQFAYPLLIRRAEAPVVVLHVDDHVLATQFLMKHGFKLLDHRQT